MTNIGSIGAGIAGLQLGLWLRLYGLDATIYTQYTTEHQLAARLPNLVVRSAPTCERERRLGVNHWDAPATDLTHFSFSLRRAQPLAMHSQLDQAIGVHQ